MGCDIHLFVEAKNPKTGKWEHRPDAPQYDRRNYNVFAILADVRNGYGFAGVVTGKGFNVIAQPRGIPGDISPKVAKANDDWSGDGHSHSFLILKELLDFNWEQTTQHQGVVSAKEYEYAKATGKPQSWAGGVWGPRIQHVSNEEMDVIIANNEATKDHHTVFLWEESYKDSADDFYFEFLVALKDFAATKELSSEDIRIVFWFDN